MNGRQQYRSRGRGGRRDRGDQGSAGPRIRLEKPREDEDVKTIADSPDGKSEVAVQVYVMNLPSGGKVVVSTEIQGQNAGTRELEGSGLQTFTVNEIDQDKPVEIIMTNQNSGQTVKLVLNKAAKSDSGKKTQERIRVTVDPPGPDGWNKVTIECLDPKGRPENGSVRVQLGQTFFLRGRTHRRIENGVELFAVHGSLFEQIWLSQASITGVFTRTDIPATPKDNLTTEASLLRRRPR
jgi:hypothetical protein